MVKLLPNHLGEFKQTVLLLQSFSEVAGRSPYLLWAFGHIRRFLAPVALHYVTLDDCTIYWNNGMGSTVVGGKPLKKITV